MLAVNFKQLYTLFVNKKILRKSFYDFNKSEIIQMCEAVLETVDTGGEYKPPFLTKEGEFVIPFRAPMKYRWWQEGGQSLTDTLKELNAPEHILEKYRPTKSNKVIEK